MTTSPNSFDVLVVGGGIAGASIGYELATDHSVCLLEMEPTLAFHTTGRSVATFLESYGGRTIRILTTASRPFMEEPPDEFDRPLLTPLPLVWAARNGEVDDLKAMHDAVLEFVPSIEMLTATEVLESTKVMRADWVAAGLREPGASEIDVAALHGGYVRGLKARGGIVHTSAGVALIKRHEGRWHITDTAGSTYDAAIIVNAAGSWCDQIAALAEVAPVGIAPMRRTVFMVSPPTDVYAHDVPLTADANGTFYIKPEGVQILCSPADEVPSEPCDAKPQEIDIAMAIEVINDATILDIRSVRSSWAGLRNFVADRSPVAGFDDLVPGFFWFVGQGGYGIQIAPALAQAGATLIRSGELPEDLVERGLEAEALGRARLHGLSVTTDH
jgi:D-arginine dehydrogenase